MEKRKQKEAEAQFGDYSARLVKRPQKNFLWGYGTQVYDETRDFFTKSQLTLFTYNPNYASSTYH